MVVKSIDQKKCIRCSKCYKLCPMDVFRIENEDIAIKYVDDCQSCYLCVYECPTEAIHVLPDRPAEIKDVYDYEYIWKG